MENFSLIRLSANELREAIDPGFVQLEARIIIGQVLAQRGLSLEELAVGDTTLAGMRSAVILDLCKPTVQPMIGP